MCSRSTTAGDGAFDAAEQSLLRELADDLAYGIQALRTAANERQAEQALRESQSKLVMAMDLAGVAHWEFDAETESSRSTSACYAAGHHRRTAKAA